MSDIGNQLLYASREIKSLQEKLEEAKKVLEEMRTITIKYYSGSSAEWVFEKIDSALKEAEDENKKKISVILESLILNFDCEKCGGTICEDDEFFWFNDDKICEECWNKLVNYYEDEM